MKQAFLDFIAGFSGGQILEIKLRHLLELRPKDALLQEIKTAFPPVDIGSITLVDQILLLLMADFSQARRIVEIGTFQGYSARLLVKNTAADIFTIDLPPLMEKQLQGDLILGDARAHDDYLRDVQNETGALYLSDLSAGERARVHLIKHDSTTLDFVKSFGTADLVFIDGGHTDAIVRQDTANARQLLAKTGGIIVWHDFASTIYSDVASFLREESQTRKIFHVLGSLCAFEVIYPES